MGKLEPASIRPSYLSSPSRMTAAATPRQLATMLAQKLGCLGPDYFYYRTGLANGLAAMRGLKTRYSEADVNGIMRVKVLFQKFTGFDREKRLELWDNTYYRPLLAAHDEWTESHGVDGGLFSSLLKSLCRPCANAEIENNLTNQEVALRKVLNHCRFGAFLKEQPDGLRFVGSLASGLFGAFSDLDLGLKSSPISTRHYLQLKEAARTEEVDVFEEAIERRAIQLKGGDIFALKYQPGSLRHFYFAANIHGATSKQIDSL